MSPQATLSANERRLHLHHGPIDLIISADGPPEARTCAFAAATSRFDGLLDELVSELDILRTPLGPDSGDPPIGTHKLPTLRGAIAHRMMAAVIPYRDRFPVTPMAAVAGAVADEIGATITGSDPSGQLTRWMVNNGGDIALGLAPGHSYRLGLHLTPPTSPSGTEQTPIYTRYRCQNASLGSAGVGKAVTLTAEMGIGGVATSGRHGRSFSLGIADAVTVFASDAATADAAATLIANRVDLPGHPAIERLPANELEHDNDLRDRLVTTSVGNLTGPEISTALHAGLTLAEKLVTSGTIIAAALHLLDSTVSTVAVSTTAVSSLTTSAVVTSNLALSHHQEEVADDHAQV